MNLSILIFFSLLIVSLKVPGMTLPPSTCDGRVFVNCEASPRQATSVTKRLQNIAAADPLTPEQRVLSKQIRVYEGLSLCVNKRLDLI